MAVRKPLVVANGQVQEIPAGDSLFVPTVGMGDTSNAAASTQFVANAVGRALVKNVTGGTTSLNDLEASNAIISVTGTLTSDAILEIPANVYRTYAISNETTGAFSLSVKQAGSTPVAGVARNKRNLVVVNGTGAYDGLTDFESIVMTGVPLAPTMPTSADGFEVANTAFVKAAIAVGAAFASYSYDGRNGLRSNVSGAYAVVDGLGLFQYIAGSDEPDDDESCFATASGRWLLQAVHWDLVDAWQLPEVEERTAPLRGVAFNSITSVAATTQVSFTGVVAGAVVGDCVFASPPDALGARIAAYARVTAADTVTVYLNNPSASTQSLSAGTWQIAVFK